MKKLILSVLLALPLVLCAEARTLANGNMKKSNGHMDMDMDMDKDHMDMDMDMDMDKDHNDMSERRTGRPETKRSNGGKMDHSDAKKSNGKKMNGLHKGNSKIEWIEDYSVAMQKAQKEHKPLFLYFTGSDWCGWCKKLDQEVFSQPEFAKSAGNKYVFVMLDFPMNRNNDAYMQQNAKLKQQYGVTGFPTVVLLDSKGAFIAETGYRSGGARSYVEHLDQMMKSPM